jgi:hypothetical protein
MDLNDFMFFVVLPFTLVFAFVAEKVLKNQWLGQLVFSCLVLSYAVQSFADGWFLAAYAIFPFWMFVRTWFMYPSRLERLKAGQIRMPNFLVGIIFDVKIAREVRQAVRSRAEAERA